jgi:hypothetical protein
MIYKDLQNNLHDIDPEFIHILPEGCVQITDEEAETLRPVLPPPLIAAISPRQIRMALTRADLRTYVEAAVFAGDQDLKDWWEFSTSFERLNPQVIAMGEALGKTSEELDNLWLLGATL